MRKPTSNLSPAQVYREAFPCQGCCLRVDPDCPLRRDGPDQLAVRHLPATSESPRGIDGRDSKDDDDQGRLYHAGSRLLQCRCDPPSPAGAGTVSDACGRPRTLDETPTGSQRLEVFKQCKVSGWSEYTLTNTKKNQATVRICIKCRNRREERGKHGREA